MTAFRYVGPPNRTRFLGSSVSVGDTVSPPDNLVEAFSNHAGFEAIEAPKATSAKPTSSKKYKKPAELPDAEKETSKE